MCTFDLSDRHPHSAALKNLSIFAKNNRFTKEAV